MKNILLVLGVLMSGSAFAQDVILDTMTVKLSNAYPDNLSICDKNKCSSYNSNVQDYLVSIVTTDGKSIKDQIKNETSVEAILINQNEKNIIKITYKEKTQAGYFNDKEELDPFFSNRRVTVSTNNEKVFYLPVTTDKKYNVKVDNNKNIDVVLK